MNPQADAAARYLEMGFSIIPVGHDKKPRLAWAPYQETAPTPEAVRKWWKDFPGANIGIVTGPVSGLLVVDADSQEAVEKIESYLPETYTTPIASTPRGGRHYYFRHADGFPNRANLFPGCDIRTQGGYVVAPPGSNGNGGFYAWLPGLSIEEVAPAPMPEPLLAALLSFININAFTNRGRNIADPGESNSEQQSATLGNISFEEGGRDEALFHLANHLTKGGMPTANIEKYMLFFASHCSPPFPQKEAISKIQSAMKRSDILKVGLTEAIRQWVSATWGNFSVTEWYQSATLRNSEDKAKSRVVFGRLVEEGIIERIPGRNGWYRKVDADCETMNFLEAPTESTDLWMPFNLHRMVEIMPGNIIVIAGEPNAGKTGILLNIVRQNMARHTVHYFNSEMGASELRKRLENFSDTPLGQWRFNAYERSGDFADVIKPGAGNINIIDFLEIHDDFYRIGGDLAAIHKKLCGAIAIIALQKNKGSDTGLGGFRSLEKPRLYLAVSPNKIKIVKAKNWKDPKKNPNGLEVSFKLAAGCILSQRGEWAKPTAAAGGVK
ncbi:MAG: bifunctional DNA primase/polymerase [Desulfobacterales bacterium]